MSISATGKPQKISNLVDHSASNLLCSCFLGFLDTAVRSRIVFEAGVRRVGAAAAAGKSRLYCLPFEKDRSGFP